MYYGKPALKRIDNVWVRKYSNKKKPVLRQVEPSVFWIPDTLLKKFISVCDYLSVCSAGEEITRTTSTQLSTHV